MSVGYSPKNEQTQFQSLRVKNLDISGSDQEMFSTGSSSVSIPSFGSASSFAVLAHSGISNTGATSIVGDIGSYPTGTITGFPPGVVSGTIHTADAATLAAKTDAAALYTLLAAHSATAIPANLNGQTLTPGYYSTGTANLAASGAGTLTLDAGGDPNAIFVIKASSTLTTGAGGLPTITLANGAVANQVFFLVGTSATINSGTAGTFNGNILAQISITVSVGGGTVNGRMLAGLGNSSGAVTFGGATTVNLPSPGLTSTLTVLIREYVDKVFNVSCKNDVTNLVTQYAMSSISIVDSVAGTAGGDQKSIKITGLASLAVGDCLTVKYSNKQ